MNDVEAIKSRVNIVEIVSEKVRLKKAGANYFGLCPFHNEKSPSFSVNENIQIFKCFGCGESGDVLAFIMKSENVEFREALETLADKVGYKLSKDQSPKNKEQNEAFDKIYKVNEFVSNYYQKKLLEGKNEGILYAKKRNLTKSLIDRFGIGYASENRDELSSILLKKLSSKELVDFGLSVDKEGRLIDKYRNRLIFSIFDEKGRVIGFSGRYIGKDDPNFKPPKYLNSPETLVFKKSNILFGLFQSKEKIRKLNFVILSEGQMNIISSHKVGVENIVASLGTSFTESHLKLLSKYTDNIYLAFDKDSAGKKAMLRTLEMCFREDVNVKIVNWESKYGKDPDEVINSNQKVWIESVNNPVDPVELICSEFQEKNKSGDLDTINKFLKIILKLVASHKNDIKKEFYLKYLSDKLGYTITALKDMLRKGEFRVFQKQPAPNAEVTSAKKTNVLTIYDKIFALVLQNWTIAREVVLTIDRDLLPQQYRDLYDYLVLFSDEEEINIVRDNIDDSQKELFDNLILMNILIDGNITIKEHVSKMIPISQKEYKRDLFARGKVNPEDLKLKQEIDKVLNINNEL